MLCGIDISGDTILVRLNADTYLANWFHSLLGSLVTFFFSFGTNYIVHLCAKEKGFCCPS